MWCALGLHRFAVVRDTGLHHYRRCARCGARDVVRLAPIGHQPVDYHWLETGEWFDWGKVEPAGAD